MIDFVPIDEKVIRALTLDLRQKGMTSSSAGLGLSEFAGFKELLGLLMGKAEDVEGLKEGTAGDILPPEIYAALMQLLNPASSLPVVTAVESTPEEPNIANNKALAGLDIVEKAVGEPEGVEQLLDPGKGGLDPSKSSVEPTVADDEANLKPTAFKLPSAKPSKDYSELERPEPVEIGEMESPPEMGKMAESLSGVEEEFSYFRKAKAGDEEREEIRERQELLKMPENAAEILEIIPSDSAVEDKISRPVAPEEKGVSVPENYKEELPAVKDAIFDQLVEKMQVVIRGPMKEIRIKIKPEHLGEMWVRITQERGELCAEFFVKNAQLKEILQSGIQEIKGQILKQGYEINDIKVYDFAMHYDLQQQSEKKYEDGRHSNGFYRKFHRTAEEGKIAEILEGVSSVSTPYGIEEGLSTINYII